MNRRNLQALRVLAGVILIRGFAAGGITMTASLFLPPVSRELGVGIGTLSIYFSVMSVVAVVWLPFAGKLMGRVPVRVLAPAAAALQALTFAGFGRLGHVAGWYVLAVPQAMGTAILTALLGPVLIHRWFPRNTGLVMGIQMAFVWLFAAALQPATSWLIGRFGWRNAYLTAGLVVFGVVTLAALTLLRDWPPQQAGRAEETEQAAPQARGDVGQGGEGAALRSAPFVLLLLFFFGMTGAGVFTQHIPTYGELMGYSLGEVGLALSLASVGSAIGSFAIGLVCDRAGGLRTCYGIILLWVLAVALFLRGGAGFWVFAAASFLHGIASSSIAVLGPILTLAFFGERNYESLYAKVSMGSPLASVLLVPAYGYVYDAARSYVPVLVLLLVLLGAALLAIGLGWSRRARAETENG